MRADNITAATVHTIYQVPESMKPLHLLRQPQQQQIQPDAFNNSAKISRSICYTTIHQSVNIIAFLEIIWLKTRDFTLKTRTRYLSLSLFFSFACDKYLVKYE